MSAVFHHWAPAEAARAHSPVVKWFMMIREGLVG